MWEHVLRITETAHIGKYVYIYFSADLLILQFSTLNEHF